MRSIILLMVVGMVSAGNLHGYQAPEKSSSAVLQERTSKITQIAAQATQGFYESLKAQAASDTVSLVHEPNVAGKGESNVWMVNGNSEFFHGVIQPSYQQLVVVKVFANNSQESVKASPVFQQVATKLTDNALFVAMDLFGRKGQAPENYQLVVNLMMMVGVRRLALPTFLFFRNGKLLKKSPVEQGFKPEEELVAAIQNRFQ